MKLSKLLFASLCTFPLLAQASADDCLAGQDLNAEDVDISKCPPLPSRPDNAPLGSTGEQISLGAWELGQTAEGGTYKYGSLSAPDGTAARTLSFADGTTQVNEGNLSCWAKGYYRLRAILQNPPADYVKLRKAGYQVRFFQFQTDQRNGAAGYREISSYHDHLVKWVTVIKPDGTCVQPTLGRFQAYLTAELERRGLQATVSAGNERVSEDGRVLGDGSGTPALMRFGPHDGPGLSSSLPQEPEAAQD